MTTKKQMTKATAKATINKLVNKFDAEAKKAGMMSVITLGCQIEDETICTTSINSKGALIVQAASALFENMPRELAQIIFFGVLNKNKKE